MARLDSWHAVIRIGAGAACLAVLLSDSIAGQPPAVQRPTFNRDVAPIFYRHCVTCHRPQQMAPMSLVSYQDARPWARAIRQRVAAREMPPWYADERFGTFSNDARLSADELATILAWVDGGAVEGEGKQPAPPAFEADWSSRLGRPPDVIIDMPMAMTVPAEGQWPTLSVYSPLPGTLRGPDRFLEAVQLLPGNLTATHHSSLSMRAFPPGVSLGQARPWPDGPLLTSVPVVRDRRNLQAPPLQAVSAAQAFSATGTSHLVFYFPGNAGLAVYPPGVGKRLSADEYVEWSVHYSPTGQPETDRHRAGFWLQRVPPAREVITLRIGDFHIVNGTEIVLPAGITTNAGHAAVVDVVEQCNGAPCISPRSMLPPIPPGDSNWRVTAISPFQNAATLYSAYPHAHKRLKDMTYVVTGPDGRETTILSVPRYDFNWQLVYAFKEPLQVAAGSTIKVIGHYDNSSGNRWNPAPEKPVFWSEQSWDEMFNGFVDLSIDRFDLTRRTDAAAEAETPLVISTGCAERRHDGNWLLTQASGPRQSSIVHADEGEIAQSRTEIPGRGEYRLIGAADFASVDDLLAQGQRSQFTTTATANVTAELRHGRRVGVKGLLLGAPEETRLNLLSVWDLGEPCRLGGQLRLPGL